MFDRLPEALHLGFFGGLGFLGAWGLAFGVWGVQGV